MKANYGSFVECVFAKISHVTEVIMPSIVRGRSFNISRSRLREGGEENKWKKSVTPQMKISDSILLAHRFSFGI